MRAVLDHIDQHVPDVWTYWFKLDGEYDFIAGQYADMRVAHDNPDNRGDTRIMSFASSPTEPLLGIITRFVPSGSTFKAAMKTLQPGDSVDVLEPLGDFVLPKDPSIPLIFVAGGIGISPIRSIITQLVHDNDSSRDVTVLYAARDDKNLIFEDVFKQQQAWLDFQTYTYDNRLELDTILEVVNKKPAAYIFLSGTENMVYWLNTQLQKSGIPREQIVLDSFDGYDR